LLLVMTRPRPSSTLFPYTTLFRSGERGALERAVRAQRTDRVRRAARVVAAGGGEPGRHDQLVAANQPGEQPGHRPWSGRLGAGVVVRVVHVPGRLGRGRLGAPVGAAHPRLPPSRRAGPVRAAFPIAMPRERSTASLSSAKSGAALLGSARTTTSAPSGSSLSRARTISRNRRRTLLRCTAPPTALETTKPT